MSLAESSPRFPRSARLLTRHDYGRVFAKPLRSTDACFTLLGRINGREMPRLGLAIAKKHARRAVDRNRIKRLVRESFRGCRHQIGGIDIVVLSRPGIATRSRDEVRASLDKHWEYLARQCRSSSSC